jgi:hypothetical protein
MDNPPPYNQFELQMSQKPFPHCFQKKPKPIIEISSLDEFFGE